MRFGIGPALTMAGAAALAACGGRSSSGLPGGDAGTPQPDAPLAAVPLEHRSAASACPTDRPPGNASSYANATTVCRADSDCTQGQNGRCVVNVPIGPVCTYDQCFGDGDCGDGGVCACRNEPLGNNVCLQSGCRVDADCAQGYCSPSYGYCRSDGVVQYACHSPADVCVNDGDCPTGNPDGPMLCSFDPSRGHWACLSVGCPL